MSGRAGAAPMRRPSRAARSRTSGRDADGQLDRRGVVPAGRRRDRAAPGAGRGLRPALLLRLLRHRRRAEGRAAARCAAGSTATTCAGSIRGRTSWSLLDAPAEVFFARKGEGTLELIEPRRQEYLAQADMFRSFVIVDAQQPTDAVVAEVRERDRLVRPKRATSRRGGGGPRRRQPVRRTVAGPSAGAVMDARWPG